MTDKIKNTKNKEEKKKLQAEKKLYELKENVYDEPPTDKLRIIEMQLNKRQNLLDKAKLIVMRIDNIIIMIPYTQSRIETRARSIVIN